MNHFVYSSQFCFSSRRRYSGSGAKHSKERTKNQFCVILVNGKYSCELLTQKIIMRSQRKSYTRTEKSPKSLDHL